MPIETILYPAGFGDPVRAALDVVWINTQTVFNYYGINEVDYSRIETKGDYLSIDPSMLNFSKKLIINLKVKMELVKFWKLT